MRRRPLSFPVSHREKLRQNAKALEALAAASGRQHPPHLAEQIAKAAEPAKQRQRRLPTLDAQHKPLEREIQRAIIEALRLHPRVIKVTRFNSGGSLSRDANGREHLVLFSSEPVPDLFGLLRNPPGFFWYEVKRDGWSRPRDYREERQAAFLEAVRQAGGIGQFVRSVDEALEAIK